MEDAGFQHWIRTTQSPISQQLLVNSMNRHDEPSPTATSPPPLFVPDEVRDVTPVLWIYVSHVPLEVLPTDLYLPLEAGLVAGFPRPGHSGLCDAVCS